MNEEYPVFGRVKSGAAGFTLVELLVVMTLLVIVIAVAAPSLGNFFHGRTLDNEARRLLALTRYAQSRAVSEGMPMVLWLDEQDRCYGVEEDSGYAEVNTNMVFTVDKDLEMEVVMINRTPASGVTSKTKVGLTPSVAAPANPHRNLPGIRFLEDGTISETSPELIRLRGRENEVICVAQARQHLSAIDVRPNVAIRSVGYEIRTQTNQWDETELYR